MSGERSRLKDRTNSERFALRRAERRMAASVHEMNGELRAFSARLERVELTLEAEFRVEHWGHEPERPVSWRVDHRDALTTTHNPPAASSAPNEASVVSSGQRQATSRIREALA